MKKTTRLHRLFAAALFALMLLAALLGGCSTPAAEEEATPTPPAEEEGAPAPEGGETEQVTATGAGRGMGGDVVVEVVAGAATIYSITVVEHNETPGIGTPAIDELPAAIVEAQSLLVDGVAGATLTSNAIKDGVREALESAGIDPSVFEVEPAEEGEAERTAETIDCDVVIIGAGGAGLTAAVQANQAGADVIIVEKMAIVGGNTLRATGGMNAAGTPYQEALGITDSGVQEFITDTMNGGHNINNIDLVTTMAENSAAGIDWLTEIGAPLPNVKATGGTEHKYLHAPEDGSAVGPYIVEKLNAKAEELGITIMLNTTATEIVMKDGAAAGILANDEAHDYTINAGAVIIAAGGFGNNFDMMTQYNPSLAGAVTTNHPGATGDGITMGVAVGAATVDMEQIQLHPTVYQETGLLVTEGVRSDGGILVNAEGNRFCNDMSTRDAVSAAELEQPGSYAYIIFDQRVVDGLAATQTYINNGLTVQGDTYEELAAAMGLTGDAVTNFVNTMNTWNESVATGVDEAFGRSNGMDEDLSTAPFYAIKIAPGIHHPMGGLEIDTETQVIDTEGNVIPGLFAAGEVTGGVHGGNRIGGNAVCDIVVFGRIAGTNAAEYAVG